MTPDLSQLALAYGRLEVRLHDAIDVMSQMHCAQCPTPCCESRHCSDIAESPWLLSVAKAMGADIPAGDSGEGLSFLGARGCTLPAGRPIQCTAYVCDRLSLTLGDPVDAFLYHALSSVLPFVVRRIHGQLDLTDLEDPDDLTAGRRGRLLRRIDTAHQCLDAVAAVRADRTAGRAPAADDLLLLARTFPFAARHVRFPGEAPDVSRALRPGM